MAGVKKQGVFDLGNSKVAVVKVVDSNYTNIKTELGVDILASDAPIPTGKIEIASGKSEAIAVGCFPIAVYYKVSGKLRRGIVLCAPSKADTAIQELKGKTFNGKTIIRAMPPRRVKYVI